VNSTSEYRLGLILVTASAVIWSTAGLYTRLVSTDLPTTLLWRGVFGALGITTLLALQKRSLAFTEFRAMGWREWAYACMGALGMVAFISSLRTTTVAHAAVIYAVVPFAAAGLGWIFLRERPSAIALAASSAAVVGVAIMVGIGREGSLFGDFLSLLMTLCMACLMVMSRRWQKIAMVPASGLSALLSALAVLPFATPLSPNPGDWAALLAFGITNSALGMVLFATGSKYLPAIESALIGALDAPLAPIWVWLVFSETPSRPTIIGGMIVLAAVVLHVLMQEKKSAIQYTGSNSL
jgi:drug/metabolite transporter (DMT)-like permease